MMKNRFNCERSARPDENHGHIITEDWKEPLNLEDFKHGTRL